MKPVFPLCGSSSLTAASSHAVDPHRQAQRCVDSTGVHRIGRRRRFSSCTRRFVGPFASDDETKTADSREPRSAQTESEDSATVRIQRKGSVGSLTLPRGLGAGRYLRTRCGRDTQLQRHSAVVPRTTASRPRSFGRARDRRSDPAVPLVLRRIAVAKAITHR